MLGWVRSELDRSMPRVEARVAVGSAAVLYLIGAVLISTSPLLPNVGSPDVAAGVGICALLIAAALWTQVYLDRGLMLAWAAEAGGVVMIVVLCAATGGAGSPFSLLYFFALGHAAAFQPRARFLAISFAGLLAFLAPLAYSHVSLQFAAFGCVGAVLALLTISAIHVAVDRMREQRRRLQFLIEATASLDTSLDPQQTLRRLAEMALPQLAEVCVIDLTDETGSVSAVVAAASDAAVAERIEALHRERPGDRGVPDPVGEVLTTRRRCVLDEAGAILQEAPRETSHEAAGEIPRAAARQISREATVRVPGARGAVAAIPMIARGRMLGVISFYRAKRYERGQVALLQNLSGRAALAYDNARLYAERVHVAQTLRRSLLPPALPQIPGLEIESYFRPTGGGGEVGGDFYDVFQDQSSVWLVVGDVCGKGTEAAVLTGFLRHTTAAYARDGAGPASVLARVNRAMLRQDFEGRFATAILARVSFRESGAEVTLAVAGHPPALLARADTELAEFGVYGTLLGVFADASITEASTILQPGDVIALYTDGLTEALAPQLLTAEQLLAQLSGPPPSAYAAIEALLALVEPAETARDDIAILAARVVPGALAR